MNIIVVKSLAYLDPGSGSLLLQILLASLLGIGFATKVFWKKIVSLFYRITGREVPQEPSEQNPPDESQQ